MIEESTRNHKELKDRLISDASARESMSFLDEEGGEDGSEDEDGQ